MINTEPILSLPAFLVSFMIILIAIAGIAEIIVRKQNKGSYDALTSHEQENKLQNYYITKRKVN